MPQLSSKKHDRSGFTYNLRQSFGPYLALDDGDYLFDTRPHEIPLWLGYNASPLFGVASHVETWTAQSNENFSLIRRAYNGLLEQIERSPAGRLVCRSAPKNAISLDALNPAELIYNYISLSVLDQFAAEHQTIARTIEEQFQRLTEKHRTLMIRPFVNGTCFEFGFELPSKELTARFANAAMRAGILCESSRGSMTGRESRKTAGAEEKFLFRLNLAYREPHAALFWLRLDLLLATFQDPDYEYDRVEIGPAPDLAALYGFHQTLIELKTGQAVSGNQTALTFLETQLEKNGAGLSSVIVTGENFARYRDSIFAMQSAVYEPARRSPPEEFEMLFGSENPLSILILDGDETVATAFAGRLGLFTQERGVTSDPFVEDPKTYYSMDLTIVPGHRGGLGRILKQAMTLLAIENGVRAIHGRNRDRAARGMWAINLGLGSFELQHLTDDYPDNGEYRDCIYYRSPLEWKFDSEIESEKIFNRLAEMVNGLLLTNTVIRKT